MVTTSPDQAKIALLAAINDEEPLEVIKFQYCKYILNVMNGNKVHAAEKLGIDRRSLQRWAKKFGGK